MTLSYLRLRVRNFIGIKRADIEFTGPNSRIILVAGVNGAGKSSMIEAMSSIGLETYYARGQGSKVKAAALLHEGAEAGSISLEYPGGGRRVLYPQCEFEIAGPPQTLGSSLGIGSAKFMSLKPDERRNQLAQRFNVEPTIDDVRQWFSDKPEAGMAPFTNDGVEIDPVVLLWDRIQLSGWEPVYKACADHSSRKKGEWQGVTGMNWGSRIAQRWHPPELLPGEEYDLAQEQQKVITLNAELENLIGLQAAAGRDRQLLRQLAGLEPELGNKVADLVESEKLLQADLAERNTWLAENPKPTDNSALPVCPHCLKKIHVGMSSNRTGAKVVLTAPADSDMSSAETKRIIAAWDRITTEITDLTTAIARVQDELAVARADMAKSVEALVELDRTRNTQRIPEEEIESARSSKASQERKVQAIINLGKARATYQAWVCNEILVDGLHSDGIRHMSLHGKLGAVNAKLAEICAKAKWTDVELTPDMDATYDGRPYMLLSESERWRVDLSLTVLISLQEKAQIIVVDRLDILAPQSRPGVIYLLRWLGIYALVAMTAKELDAAPKLEAAKLGRVLWLDNGSLIDPNNT